jgi:hypothetical protein
MVLSPDTSDEGRGRRGKERMRHWPRDFRPLRTLRHARQASISRTSMAAPVRRDRWGAGGPSMGWQIAKKVTMYSTNNGGGGGGVRWENAQCLVFVSGTECVEVQSSSTSMRFPLVQLPLYMHTHTTIDIPCRSLVHRPVSPTSHTLLHPPAARTLQTTRVSGGDGPSISVS